MTQDERYEQGMAIRREMFGELTDKHVREATDFTEKFQELVTTYCFGEIWTREELPRKTRSMLTLAMLVALGRTHEIRFHVKGALANGVSKDEIREVFLQAIPYCGIPAAFDGFRTAQEVFAELEAE